MISELEYKIVEVMTVTDEEIEKVVNRWVRQGWTFEGMTFAMRESSKRPSMAFVIFTRGGDTDEEDQDGLGIGSQPPEASA